MEKYNVSIKWSDNTLLQQNLELDTMYIFSALWSHIQHNGQYTTLEILKIMKTAVLQTIHQQRQSILHANHILILLVNCKKYMLYQNFLVWFGSLAQHKVINHSELSEEFHWYTKLIAKICYNLCHSQKCKTLVFISFSAHSLKSYC
jgi:hypothetical protein